jgi:signal transduction histidine kinase
MAGSSLKSKSDVAEQDQSRMLALVVHELRSPMAVINGYLRLLVRRAEDWTDADRQLIDDASSSCGRLARMIQELDDLANLEGAHPVRAPKPVPLFQLCESVVHQAPPGQNRIAFRLDADDRAALVLGDPDRLQQAIEALLGVTLREYRSADVEVACFVSREGGGPRAIVAFGRAGLADRRSDIITRRSSFDRWRGGTGLAIPIAGRIVDIHGGRLWSVVGPNHADFALSLPIKGAR